MTLKKSREQSIGYSKKILKQPARLSPRHRRSELKEVQQLLRQEGKLFVSVMMSYTVKIRSNTK